MHQGSCIGHQAYRRGIEDDYIIEGLITLNLVIGNYRQADSLIRNHQFAQRHRDYRLRDKYRFLCYGKAAKAYQSGDYAEAVQQLELALYPPSSLGADDFQFQSAPRLHYYLGCVLEKLGKTSQARQEFEKSITGWRQLTGGREGWNSENFYIVLSMERLGLREEAEKMFESMKNFALSRLNSRYRNYRAEAHYLLALVNKKEGHYDEARRLLKRAVQIEPGMLGPRFELRGDVVDPLPQSSSGDTR